MSRSCVLLCMAVLMTFLATPLGAAWASSHWYTFCYRARVLEVEGPNLLKVKLLGRDQVVTLRLIGVGSPRNRDRVKHLSPEIVSYIEKNRLWEESRQYVQSVLQDKIVQVWTKRGDRFDDKDRLLGYIVIPADSDDHLELNGEIIRRGLGFVTRDHIHVTFARYKQLEDEARKNRCGIWRALSSGRISTLVR